MSNANTQLDINGVEWDEVIDLFGYDEPRDAQIDGMKTALETVGDNGYFVLEGACGTGKTMLALTPLISLVRSNRTNYERVVVVTSVKQQQRAFEDDLQQMNKTLPNGTKPISGLTLVGKSDVNPYSRHNILDQNENIYEVDERLRENTRSLIDASDSPKGKADELVSMAKSLMSDNDWGDDAPDYPYPAMVPATEGGREFSPFYAKYVADSFDDSDTATIPFDVDSKGLIRTDDLVELTGGVGTDPHAVMGDVMEEVEVVIANYYHIFEPTTVRQLTQELLDDETLLICDEAHNLVPRVRELLCDELSAVSIPRAQDEFEEILRYATANLNHLEQAKGMDLNTDWSQSRLTEDVQETAKSVSDFVQDADTTPNSVDEFIQISEFVKDAIRDVDGVSKDKIEDYTEFLDGVLDVVDKQVTEHLQKEFGDYWQDANPDDTIEIELRDPETPSEDKLTQWASLKGVNQVFSASGILGSFAGQCFEHIYTEIKEQNTVPTVYSEATGRVLMNWYRNDHTTFFREIFVEPRDDDGKDSLETGNPWEDSFNVTLKLQNCIPSERLADRLEEFGGGVMMSATLEPIDVFKKVTGVDRIEENGRPVTQTRYGLHFPEANRESLAVSAPAFKYNNKESRYKYSGNPTTEGKVRGTYSNVIKSVVQKTPGNVLIVMPSYDEATWAGEFLEDDRDVDKPVLIDKSSSDQETEKLKNRFFRGNGKVLTTGARGTLVEGVDYKDEKLDAVVVCGVPLENSKSPYKQAIQAAYEDYFNEGFEYAFTIPAVRKARQSIGRVIRSDNDTGVRVLVDERYTDSSRWDSVRKWIPDDERNEFKTADPDEVGNRVDAFWQFQRQRGAYDD